MRRVLKEEERLTVDTDHHLFMFPLSKRERKMRMRHLFWKKSDSDEPLVGQGTIFDILAPVLGFAFSLRSHGSDDLRHLLT
jgi:hypothetical protein